MLELAGITAAYLTVPVLVDVDLSAPAGQVTAILGSNGAGKSTLARVAAGLLRARAGRVVLDHHVVTSAPPHRRARAGLSVVTERKDLFAGLTVLDHLRLGAQNARNASADESIARVHALFPALAERPNALAGTLSGGQQQMLAIGRALAGRPTALVLDEPSLGVAPLVVAEILTAVRRLANDGLAVVLIEQNARQALKVADHTIVLQRGRVVFSGPPADLAGDAELHSYYLGTA